MSDVKYIFISGEDGSMSVHEDYDDLYKKCKGGHGYWIVEVPKSFQIVLTLDNVADQLYVYEYVLEHKDSVVIDQD